MIKRDILPSIKETAFCCPHCGAFTTQHWFNLARKAFDENTPLPQILTSKLEADAMFKDVPWNNNEEREFFATWAKKMLKGEMFVETRGETEWRVTVQNLSLSECFNCKKFAIWIQDRLIHPNIKEGPAPNPDLPNEIIMDYEEAQSIVNISPRGAAALLRLCIQKICLHLGEKGKSIDEDIASLVVKGLDPLIQKSLDIVRVVGNEAVHPGVLDLKDDRDTTNKLFSLVNTIADRMITYPKNIAILYDSLPVSKKEAIEKRDGRI